MKEKKKFIEQSVKNSKELKIMINIHLLNHELIDRGGFEDFIFIPNELVLNCFSKLIEKKLQFLDKFCS